MNLRSFLAVLAIVSFPSASRAGSWVPPCDFEALSANGEHRVTVHAPGKGTDLKSRIVTESKIAGEWNKKWTQEVVNEVMPLNVILNDSGTRVITLGNWYGKEAGKNSLVVYDRDRVLAQYSTEDLSGPEVQQPMTSAGSAWLMNSYYGFDEDLGFYLWLDFAKKWSVIDMTNGRSRKLTPKLVSQCEDLARESLLSQINAKEPDFRHFKLLSRFMRPEDKKIFEPLLNHRGDHLGCGTRHQSTESSPDYGLVEYFQTNQYRDLAEAALDALAEGSSDTDYPRERHDQYKRLGILQLSAKFDQLPKKEDGVIVIWLEPIEQKGIALARTRPAHALSMTLLWNSPEQYGINPKAPKDCLPIRLYGVTPGRYHVRGVWSKKTQSAVEIDKNFWTLKGEEGVIEGTIVELKAGETTAGKIVFKPSREE